MFFIMDKGYEGGSTLDADVKIGTEFLVELGLAEIPHTETTYLAHLVGLHHYMKEQGCAEEVCRAGLFHSIYGTELFQGFRLPLEKRPQVRTLIGERAEKLAYLNCAMDRASFDAVLEQARGPYRFRDRITGEEVVLDKGDYDDLCSVHLYDFLEQVPRSQWWDYRRESYRKMAERLGARAVAAFDSVFAGKLAADGPRATLARR
jgi:hypothetical protein